MQNSFHAYTNLFEHDVVQSSCEARQDRGRKGRTGRFSEVLQGSKLIQAATGLRLESFEVYCSRKLPRQPQTPHLRNIPEMIYGSRMPNMI